jgi:GDP-4-dehydro-6-deoxy-D-mannose reductase
MAMRALVTGGTGFVGGHLVRSLLAAGVEVTGTSAAGGSAPAGSARLRWLPLDLTSADSIASVVDAAEPDVVYHLAAQSSVGGSFGMPGETWDVNATGTWRLLQALGAAGRRTRVVFASSAEVYGAVPEAEQPIREDRVLRPASPYAAAKAAAEMACVQATLAGTAEVVIARSFNHTGPGQDTRFALPSFASQLRRMRAGAEAVLRVGNLAARRDMLDVRDVVDAYVLLAGAGEAGRAYNVCSGRAESLRWMVDELVRASGIDARVEVDPARVRPVDLPLLVGDSTRVSSLGWAPRIPLEQTLADLLAAAADEPGSTAGRGS